MGLKLTISLLLPLTYLTFWTRSRLPCAYLSKMAVSALAARAKIRPPCTLKPRVRQEYNSLLVNALKRIFESNLSLNNFKWLLTKLELSCVRNIIPRSRKRLWNRYPVLNQELQNHYPVGRHIPVKVMYGSIPPGSPSLLTCVAGAKMGGRNRFLSLIIPGWQIAWSPVGISYKKSLISWSSTTDVLL